MTYRPGNHWGVTIVREGDETVHHIQDSNATTTCCKRTPFELPHAGGHRLTVDEDQATCPRREGDELVAVVVNGDTGIAQRICDLLNADSKAVP